MTAVVPVLTGLTATNFAGVDTWKVQFKHESVTVRHFESPGYANGSLASQHIQGGTTDWSVNVGGSFDGDSATGADTDDRLKVGNFVYFDLILSKGSSIGRYGCVGKVVSLEHGPQLDEKKPQSFQAVIEGHGVLPSLTAGS